MKAISPLFSILIPTMNRPKLVMDSISSVLMQDITASDFEVVVSNNGGCSETKKIVTAFQKEYSIRYIQPKQQLNMPDHWEWASSQLQGEYVLVLPDRRMLRQGTLLLLSNLIRENSQKNVEVVTWPDAWFFRSGILSPNGDGEGFITSKSDSIIKKLTQEYLDNSFLPLGLNSCIKRKLLDSVRVKRGRVYSPISPDFSSAFSILCVAENIIRFNKYLSITQGFSTSNGGKVTKGDKTYLDSLKGEGENKFVPTKSGLVWEIIYEDFFRTMHAFDKNIKWDDFNPAIYYTRCWQDISIKRMNLPFSKSVAKDITDFRAALERETSDRKLMVKIEMKRMSMMSSMMSLYTKHILVKLIGNNTASKLRTIYHKLRGRKIYSCGLEASGFTRPYKKSLELN